MGPGQNPHKHITDLSFLGQTTTWIYSPESRKQNKTNGNIMLKMLTIGFLYIFKILYTDFEKYKCTFCGVHLEAFSIGSGAIGNHIS